jgi:hypothetical protein
LDLENHLKAILCGVHSELSPAAEGTEAMHSILPDLPIQSRTAATFRTRRLLRLSGILIVALVVMVTNFLRYGLPNIETDDFVEYWAAGRLNVTDGNPYAANELMALQLQAGWDEAMPLMMWNPPPALTVVMPFGLLDYQLARPLWLLISLMLVAGCTEVLWRLYGGKPEQHLWGLLASIFFFPTLQVLDVGQIGVWILVGLVGFTVSMQHKRWAAAGAALILIALKPHVTYLIWVALGLWWLRRRVWTLVAGFLAILLLTWLVPTLVNPQVTSQYLEAVRTAPPLYWMTATLGSLLRLWFGPEREWLQFAPSLLGLGWLAWQWHQHAATWDWAKELPLLLLVSTITMSFGWPFDLVVLIPAVVQMTIWTLADPSRGHRIGTFAFYGASNGLAIWHLQRGAGLHDFVWLAPALLLIFLFVRTRHHHLLATGASVSNRVL